MDVLRPLQGLRAIWGGVDGKQRGRIIMIADSCIKASGILSGGCRKTPILTGGIGISLPSFRSGSVPTPRGRVPGFVMLWTTG
jgi:hypothetical protein